MSQKYLKKLNRNNTKFMLQLFEYFKTAEWGSEYNFLKYYQNITRLFAKDIDIDARGLLVQYEMGLGKSILAIAIAIDNIDDREVIILLTKSLQENMHDSIHKYVNMRRDYEPDYYLGRLSKSELNDWIKTKFSFVSMNASNMMKQMERVSEGDSAAEFDKALEAKYGEVLKMASLDGKLLIVDEAHNLFRAITNGSRNAIGLYDLIMKARNLKIMFFTGTPVSNDPFELVPCFNMLGSKSSQLTFPEHYTDFNKLFVGPDGIKNKNKFQNRILGLVSYISHESQPGKAFSVKELNAVEFPEEKPIVVERVHMDPVQYVMYQLARDKEKEEGGGKFGSTRIKETPALTKPKSGASSTYRVESRQLSNYNPPQAYRGVKDPTAIPLDEITSPKYQAAYKNIMRHNNQLGLAYSQFTAMGGLGTFARFLEANGWQQVGGEPKAVTGGDPAGDCMAEYAESIADDMTNMNAAIHGAHVPTAIEYIENLNAQLANAQPDWWLPQDTMDYNGGVDSVDDSDVDNVDSVDSLESDSKLTVCSYKCNEGPTNEFNLMDELDTDDVSADDADDMPAEYTAITTQYAMKYATIDDVETLHRLDPNYHHDDNNMKFPRYILIVSKSSAVTIPTPIGYVQIEYADDKSSAKILMHTLDSELEAPLLKIILNAINTEHRDGESTKLISGGAVDTTGAAKSKLPDRVHRYAIISGGVDVDVRTAIKDMFNADSNKHGGSIDLILVSAAGAEGLDLKNLRHIHVLDPYWNWGRIKQIIARGVRVGSHLALPKEEKNVTPYMYLAIPPESEKNANGTYIDTTDVELYNDSIMKQVVIETFLDALKEVSIECLVNGEEYCRVCNPTDQPLYTNNVFRDITAPDPCSQVKESVVKAKEIMVNGDLYYYVDDPDSIYDYKVFVFDGEINGYKPMSESDPVYIKIIDAIAEDKVGKTEVMGKKVDVNKSVDKSVDNVE